MFRPLQIANEFVRLHGAAGQIDPLKAQKLTYLSHGWWLAITGTRLLTERPQVWRYGPVFPTLYNTLNRYGRSPIVEPAGAGPFGNAAPLVEGQQGERVRQLVDWVWSEWGHLTGPQLSDMTHALGTPWREIAEANNFRVPLNTEIPDKMDWQYFADLAVQREFPVQPLKD